SYWSLTRGTLNIPRDYNLFTVLALGPGGIKDELPYPPRGLPVNLSSDACDYFYSPAEDVQKDMLEWFGDEEEFEPEEYAAELGEAGIKEYKENGLLPTPELYAHSWLNLIELKEVLAYGKLTKGKLSIEFSAILVAMEELAETCGPENVRLVFC